MMGATAVSRDEIAKTTQEYDPTFEGIDCDDPNSMLYATQLLTRIELTAATHSLTMRECKCTATEHGPQHKRAEAAGKLIHSVSQWAAADRARLPGERQPIPPMPTLLGGAAAPAATGRRRRHDEDDAPDDDAAAAGHAMTEGEHRMAREQREQEAADWQRRVDTRERQIEEHALELQRQLQDQQLTRHKQQQERQQQQDETDALEQRRQQLTDRATAGVGKATTDFFTGFSTATTSSTSSTTTPSGAASPGDNRAARGATIPTTVHSAISTKRVHHTTPDAHTALRPSGAASARATTSTVGPVSGGNTTCEPRRTIFRRPATDGDATADTGRRTADGNCNTRMGSDTFDDGRSGSKLGDSDRPAPPDEH
jgi:hypothetical protein